MRVMEFCLIMNLLEEETFVSRKISRGLSRVMLGLDDFLYLGNLNAKRDWGHAKDYVEMQWLMLQQENQKILCVTSTQFSVRDFVLWACEDLGSNNF